MKRDMDLVRQIMLKIEELPAGPPVQFRMGEVEDPVMLAHLEMMIATGLVNGKITQPYGARGAVIIVSGLSWEGHEWIDTVRSESVWESTKAALLDKAGVVSFELSKAVATQLMRRQLGLPG